MQQLVDRDVLLDRGECHARGADDLVHAQVAEQLLVLGVVDARDGARHVEVMLGHLAHDEVVLVVTGHRGHDAGTVCPASARCLPSQPSLLSTMLPSSSAICRARPAILLEDHQLVTGLQQLLGEEVADLPASDDDDVHEC